MARWFTRAMVRERTRHCATSWRGGRSSCGRWRGSASTSRPSSRSAARATDGEASSMPTNRHPARHPHRGRLTHTQSMVLRYGPDPRWDAFHSEEEHRDAWARNRDRLLAAYRHDRRPMAWWRFEAPFPFPGYEREQSTLFDAGLLDEEEAAALVREWRREFERAWEPHFFHCSGPAASSPARSAGASIIVGPTFRFRWHCDGRANGGANDRSKKKPFGAIFWWSIKPKSSITPNVSESPSDVGSRREERSTQPTDLPLTRAGSPSPAARSATRCGW